MANSTLTTKQKLSDKPTARQSIGGLRFDWLMSILGFVFVAGVYLDGWAHAHGLVDQTFFTPWHAVLYSGFLINAAILVGVLYFNHARGLSWQRAMPRGYELALIGVPLFAIGGVGDAIWHTLFGFEVGTEQVLSPTHLVLAFSGILIMTGPLRAAMRRVDMKAALGWSKLLPMLLSLVMLLLMATFFTEFANPFVRTRLVTSFSQFANTNQALGVAGILLQTAILMGAILLVLRRWTLPAGTMTMLFTLNVALISVLADQYRLIPAAIAAGVIADVLLWRLKPSVEHANALRLFAFLTPLLLFLFYFIDLMIQPGIVWSIHLWLGSCVMAGIVGLAMSYLLVPPLGPVEDEDE